MHVKFIWYCHVQLVESIFCVLQPRMEEATVQPSKVIHLRNLPDNVTEKEVMMLGVPFGSVVNILLLRSKNQAFLEMADASNAATMLTYYTTVPATIR